MNSRIRVSAAIAVAATAISATACSSSGGGSSGGGAPSNIQLVVDTGPGGGSDLFARQLVKVAKDEKLISSTWPIVAQEAGGGLGAMAFMKNKKSQGNYVAAFTSKWIIAGLGTPGSPAQLDDLTPIAEVADETQVIAAPADAPYDTMAGFIAAAKREPGKLVQTGGSVNSVDNLIALEIEKQSGASWKYLSFDDGGPRITALLRGDAQIDIGAESDFSDQIAAHKLKLIGVVGDKRLADMPSVPTLSQQGVDEGTLPAQLQFRGIAGPPGMSKGDIAYYSNLLAKLVKTPEWTKYLASQGLTSHFVTGSALTSLLKSFTTTMKPLVASLASS